MFKIIERVYNNIVVEKVNAFYGTDLWELLFPLYWYSNFEFQRCLSVNILIEAHSLVAVHLGFHIGKFKI